MNKHELYYKFFDEEIAKDLMRLIAINENLIETNKTLENKIKVLKVNLDHTQKILNKTIDEMNKRIKTLEIDANLPIPDLPVFLGF